jgi:hypothetical protein
MVRRTSPLLSYFACKQPKTRSCDSLYLEPAAFFVLCNDTEDTRCTWLQRGRLGKQGSLPDVRLFSAVVSLAQGPN